MNSQEDPNTRYLSYMLRIWRKRNGEGKLVWCASLEEPGSHRTESFGDMTTMFMFLQSRVGLESIENLEGAPSDHADIIP